MVAEHFTMWPEAVATAIVTHQKVEKFMWENVTCRFGVSSTLVMDNDPRLKCEHMQAFCDDLDIRMTPSLIAYHQKNGKTKAINVVI